MRNILEIIERVRAELPPDEAVLLPTFGVVRLSTLRSRLDRLTASVRLFGAPESISQRWGELSIILHDHLHTPDKDAPEWIRKIGRIVRDDDEPREGDVHVYSPPAESLIRKTNFDTSIGGGFDENGNIWFGTKRTNGGCDECGNTHGDAHSNTCSHRHDQARAQASRNQTIVAYGIENLLYNVVVRYQKYLDQDPHNDQARIISARVEAVKDILKELDLVG